MGRAVRKRVTVVTRRAQHAEGKRIGKAPDQAEKTRARSGLSAGQVAPHENNRPNAGPIGREGRNTSDSCLADGEGGKWVSKRTWACAPRAHHRFAFEVRVRV